EVAPTACRRGEAGMPVPGGRYGITDLNKEVQPRATDLNKEVRPAALDKVLGGSLPLPESRVTMDCPHDDETVPARALLRDGRPILWRLPFPDDIVTALVSDSNPDGIINNSELELAGIVATNDVLAREVDVREATTATGTDNLPALSWSTKGAVSAKGPAAYLLRHQAMHQRVFRYQSRPFYVPGESNGMADDCSRLWHLSDSELVSYFNATYPQPQPWRLCHLEPGTASALFSALRCKRQPLPDTLAGAKSEHTRAHGGPPILSNRTGRGSWQLAVNPRAAVREDSLVTTATQHGSASSTPPLRLTTVDSRIGDAEGGAALTGDIRRGDLAGEAAQRGSVSSTPSQRLTTVDNRRGDAEGGEQHSAARRQHIVDALVSDSNPKGVIDNSELRLAGIVATNDVLARESDVRECTTAAGTDNLPALSCSTKGAVFIEGAGCLPSPPPRQHLPWKPHNLIFLFHLRFFPTSFPPASAWPPAPSKSGPTSDFVFAQAETLHFTYDNTVDRVLCELSSFCSGHPIATARQQQQPQHKHIQFKHFSGESQQHHGRPLLERVLALRRRLHRVFDVHIRAVPLRAVPT
ncbi:hypothetical protein THAOC_20704, partial [Thalassiosira oceanica]